MSHPVYKNLWFWFVEKVCSLVKVEFGDCAAAPVHKPSLENKATLGPASADLCVREDT